MGPVASSFANVPTRANMILATLVTRESLHPKDGDADVFLLFFPHVSVTIGVAHNTVV